MLPGPAAKTPLLQAGGDVGASVPADSGPPPTASLSLSSFSRIGWGLHRVVVRIGGGLRCVGVAGWGFLLKACTFVRSALGCLPSAIQYLVLAVFHQRHSFLLGSFSSTIASATIFWLGLHTGDLWLDAGFRIASAAAVFFIHAFVVTRERVWRFPRKILLYTCALLLLVPSLASLAPSTLVYQRNCELQGGLWQAREEPGQHLPAHGVSPQQTSTRDSSVSQPARCSGHAVFFDRSLPRRRDHPLTNSSSQRELLHLFGAKLFFTFPLLLLLYISLFLVFFSWVRLATVSARGRDLRWLLGILEPTCRWCGRSSRQEPRTASREEAQAESLRAGDPWRQGGEPHGVARTSPHPLQSQERLSGQEGTNCALGRGERRSVSAAHVAADFPSPPDASQVQRKQRPLTVNANRKLVAAIGDKHDPKEPERDTWGNTVSLAAHTVPRS